MKRLLLAALAAAGLLATTRAQETYDVPITSIRCSDPFILADASDHTYYMYSSGGGGRVMGRASKDLQNWTEPFTVMQFPATHWAGDRAASWAAEVHRYRGKYYLFTTSHTRETMVSLPGRGDIPHRATQIYVADSPRGPFRDFTGNKPHTPWDWAALDGTLWIEDGVPYMVFCHEWLQTVDGTMELVRLPDDLGVPTEAPVTLFKASDAPWSGEMLELGEKTNGMDIGGYVTDGPWIFRTQTGRLGMLWSSWGKERYAIGVAYSQSGSVKGPWIQEEKPLFEDNGGHGMLFRTFDGKLKLSMHWVDPRDERPGRRPVIRDVDDSGDRLRLLPEKQPVVFDLSKDLTMAGHKVALRDIRADFPRDWSDYEYLVLDMKASSGQRVYLGVNTDEGYNELRFIFYAPGGRIRTAIPLTYFRDLPAGAFDMAATYNHKRPLSFINIEHGTRHPLTGVDSLGVRMHRPVGDEQVVIYDAYLTVGDPGDKYLDARPAVDALGQWGLGDFEGKARSEAQLRDEWAQEEAALAAGPDKRFSRYGGDLSRRTKATGFFHVRKIRGRWWFVDPEGYLFLSIGSNGISPVMGGGGRGGTALKGLYPGDTPPRLPERFTGEDARTRANELTADRMDAWGMNTIGNWSGRDLIALGRKPFMTMLGGLGIQDGILGMPDVYAEGFAQRIDEAVARSTAPYVDNKMLIGYFIGNEPTWSNAEMRLCDLILQAAPDKPLRVAMERYLRQHGDTRDSRRAFLYETYEIFLSTVQAALKRHDPHHLNLGIRYGADVPAPEVLALSKKYFDVYSFNRYGVEPDLGAMDRIYQATGKPMIIGEFHFGATDRGLGESLVRTVSQEERASAYRHYCETAFSHKALIGTAWFTWTDQPFFGRGDGENYNIGIIDVTDRPYPWMTKAIRAVSDNCFRVHEGKQPPYARTPERPGGEFPDIWEE